MSSHPRNPYMNRSRAFGFPSKDVRTVVRDTAARRRSCLVPGWVQSTLLRRNRTLQNLQNGFGLGCRQLSAALIARDGDLEVGCQLGRRAHTSLQYESGNEVVGVGPSANPGTSRPQC